MLKNYIKIALRTLYKNKVYTLVNLFGLITGLTCGLLIIIYILFELSFDRYFEKADQIYRLGRESVIDGITERQPQSCAPAALALKSEYPEVVDYTRLGFRGKIIVGYEENKFYENFVAYADESIFDMFQFPMIKGNPKLSLVNPYSVVLSEDAAKKYFGNSDPIGKTIEFNNSDNYLVTGIIENLPDNTHFEFDILCSFSTLYAEKRTDIESWIDFNYITYLELKEDSNSQLLEDKFPSFIKKFAGDNFKEQGESINFFLHPLTKIHLYSHLEGQPPGKITAVYTYSTLAFFLILIACINFMNLSTARSITRSKEVGIRKVVGASRLKLIYQFLTEAILLSLISLGVSLFFIDLFLPTFSNIIGQKLTFNIFDDPALLIGFCSLTVFIGVIAGSYPAFVLSRYQPAKVLKPQISSGNKKSRIRNAFVVLQFFATTVFIIQTFILLNQIDYLKKKNIGLDKDNVLAITLKENENYDHLKIIRGEFENVRGVEATALSSVIPGNHIARGHFIPEGKSKSEMVWMEKCDVDDHFLSTLKIELKDGRDFSESYSLDDETSVIINERAAQKLGWDDPVGKTLKYKNNKGEYTTAAVVGVVNDFHLAPLYRKIEPLVICNNKIRIKHVLLKLNADNIDESIAEVKKEWLKLFPAHPFDYSFLEDAYGHYFRVLDKVLSIMSLFSILAILIACFGTFALVLYISESKRKELGIRKVMGASTFKLIYDLNKKILRMILFSIILGIIFMNLPLFESDAFFPDLGEIPFTIHIKVALMLFTIAVVTVLYQSIKSAMINPIESLREE